MNYELRVTETKNKAGKFLYEVIDEAGTVLTSRRSNRVYVACTIDGQYYFGRVDLVGKGDHGVRVKYDNGWRYVKDARGNFIMKPGQAEPTDPLPVAYVKTK